jgi:hypothetical protein
LIKHQVKLNRLYPSEYYLPVVDNQQAISKWRKKSMWLW